MKLSSRRALAAVAAALLASCSGDAFTPTTPLGAAQASEASLNVLEIPPAEPAPESTVVTFVAVSGRKIDERLYLTDSAGVSPAASAPGPDHSGPGHHGREFLRLTLDKHSLLARPDGTPFADGDTVTITIRVDDPARMLFTFLPAGLQFSPTDPAELRINYQSAQGDIDHNGHHDAQDDTLETHLGIWVQETPGAPFVRLNSLVDKHARDIRADLSGFSRYAVSY